jgi:hypothetical protein
MELNEAPNLPGEEIPRKPFQRRCSRTGTERCTSGRQFKESAPGAQKLRYSSSKGKGSMMTVTSGDMAQIAGQFSKINNVDPSDLQV